MFKLCISLIIALGIFSSSLATVSQPNNVKNNSICLDSIVGVYDGIFPIPVYLFIKPDCTYIKTDAGGMKEGNWDIQGDTITLKLKYDIKVTGKKDLINKDSTWSTVVSSSIIDGNRLISIESKDYNYEKIMDKDRLNLVLKYLQSFYSFPLDTLIGNLW